MKSTERVKRFRERHRWYRALEYAARRCTDTKHREYHRYGGRGIKCLLTKDEAKRLYEICNGHLLKNPSLDRKDPDGHYTFANCRFIELIDNVTYHRPAYSVKGAADGWED